MYKLVPYTRYQLVGDTEYLYHAETNYHDHRGETNEEIWKVQFVYFNPEYRFIYRYKKQRRVILPTSGKIYQFECQKNHGIIHESRLPLKEDDPYWETLSDITPKSEQNLPLACVFLFCNED